MAEALQQNVQEGSDTKVTDLIALSVMAHKLDSIASEMGVTMRKSSHSPIFAEANDFACSVTNWQGDQIAQLAGIPSSAPPAASAPRKCSPTSRWKTSTKTTFS